VSLKQASPVVPPRPTDRLLKDFSQIIQGNLLTLFQNAHVHKVVSAAPTAQDGLVGDLYIFDDGTHVHLLTKTAHGWYKSADFTAL